MSYGVRGSSGMIVSSSGVHAVGRIVGVDSRRVAEVVLRQVREERAHLVEGRRLVGGGEMRDAAARRMRRRAAQELRVDVLVGHGLHDVRAR